MKTLKVWYAAYAAAALGVLLWMTVPTVAVVTFAGCAAVAPGADPVVVNAERTTKNAWTLVESFLEYEKANRNVLFKADPSIKQWADKIRAEAPPAFEVARNATKAYKRNRTPENKATLATYLATVNQILADASTQATKAVRANP